MKIIVEASDLVSIMIILAFCFWIWQRHRLLSSQLIASAEGKYVVPGTKLLIGSYGNRN